MPTYVFKCVSDDCQDSGVEFEKMRLISQCDDELLCEICNKPVERVHVVNNIHKTLWRADPV